MHRTLLTWHWPGLAEWPHALVLAVLVATVFALAEVARRFGRVEVEATRKFVHVGAGLLTLLVPYVLTSMWSALALSLVGAAVLWWSARRGWLRAVHGVSRTSNGAVLFPLAMALCLVVTQGTPVRFEVPLLAVTLADAAAALVGKRYGTHRLPWSTARTMEGSAAFVVVATSLSMLSLWSAVTPAVALAGAVWLGVMLALVETCSPNGWDNITIVVVGLVAIEWVLRAPASLVCIAGVCAVVVCAAACLASALPHTRSPRRSP